MGASFFEYFPPCHYLGGGFIPIFYTALPSERKKLLRMGDLRSEHIQSIGEGGKGVLFFFNVYDLPNGKRRWWQENDKQGPIDEGQKSNNYQLACEPGYEKV